ncbi:hypothetical protein DIPPA_10853 [Diplonema papillatum]|nr:hypothetical protein DIPPA_04388 [Diplonema papillatum]KAJ9445340.1 hypothetical protein DIPPA_32443 [Diplonema papillatum]KAJ9456052.1 hypothetical protein DIPPA_10853 [Diplonema papillatum]
MRLALLVAWKSAARWAEAASLSSEQFLLVETQEIIIDWFQTPKGRKKNPFRASRYVVLLGSLTDEIAALFRNLAPFNPLTKVTTSALDRMWGNTPTMTGFTAHSIKRGAVTHILDRMVSGLADPVPPYLVDRISKHEERSGTALSDVTIRYGGNHIAMARALETGRISNLL